MVSLTIHLPESSGIPPASINEYLAVKLYQDGELSLAEAACMAGVAKWDFPGILKKYKVSIIDLSDEDLAQDVKNAYGSYPRR